MKHLLTLALALGATPALAAGETFISLSNTDFVVLCAFILFIAVLFYFKVPSTIAGLLDKRADGIRADLDEARKLREDARALLASYERKQGEVQEQADRIVANARSEAEAAAEQAKADIKKSVERRMAGATDQIASAEAAAVREVRDRAIQVATAAAREVIAEQTTEADRARMIDDSIETVNAKLH